MSFDSRRLKDYLFSQTEITAAYFFGSYVSSRFSSTNDWDLLFFFNFDYMKTKNNDKFLRLSFKGENRTVEVPLAKDGEFYLENIPAGTYSAGIVKDRKHCNFDLIIPESDAAFIDLAIILCEPVMSD